MKIQPVDSRVLLVAACLATFTFVACSRQTPISATPFPASNEVAGWTKTADTRTFSSNELWNYIDGDAERYVKAGVATTSTAEYNFHNKFDAVVDLYTMRDVAGSRAILDTEPATGADTVPLGDSARLYRASLVFRHGRYLVRIVAYKQSPETQLALQQLGRAMDQRLSP